MSAKKRNNKKKLSIKRNVRDLIIFTIIATILGLVFMNLVFTLLMLVGIFIILKLSIYLSKKKKKKSFRIILNTLVAIILIGSIAVVIGGAWFLNRVVKNSPEFNEEVLSMSQTTKIFDMNGVEITELGTEKREIIKFEDMSEVLIDALVATEDSRFFQHNGFDAPRFLAASVKQILGQKDAGGASTITMQVAKNSYNKDRSNVASGTEGIERKFSDIYLAVFKIEKNYSKQEILEFYINNHFLANNAYGVEQASKIYFNKKASQLTLSEAALIVGMFQAPSATDPFKYPETATKRRAEVLYLMQTHGYITKEERDIANAIPVKSLLFSTAEEQKFYSYLNTVVEEAIKKYDVNPHTSSLLVYTNMNRSYQTIIDDVFSGATFNWENPVVQAGVTLMDVNTGKILAIGAGRNQTGNRNHNYATSSKRQIGSVAKPLFDYGPGFEYNNWSTYTLFDDSRYYYSTGQELRNSDRGYMGTITLRTALAQSRNIPALKAFQQVNKKQVFDFVDSLGVSMEPDAYKSKYLHEAYSIGAYTGSNPLEMAGAFAAFANGGFYYEPYTINKIVFRDTGEVLTNESTKQKVMSSSTAFMMNDVLKTAVNSGLSGAAKINGVNIAAKTGTTNHTPATLQTFGLPGSALNDAWVVGYDTKLVLSIWYGYEPISRQYYTTSNSAYVQRKALFSAIGGKIFQRDGSDFPMPNTVVKVAIEMGTNPAKLASQYTPSDKIVYEYFKKGTEPTEESTVYKKMNAPSNLSLSYEPSTKNLILNWNSAGNKADDDLGLGALGYKIYKNDAYIDFTTSTSYTIKNTSNPNGIYSIRAGYQHSDQNNSGAISKEFSLDNMSTYDATLNVPANKTYRVGDSLEAYDLNPGAGDVKLLKDGVVTVGTVAISIKNKDGDTVSGIDTIDVDKYTITYVVSYKSAYTKTLTRTVTIDP